jgi:hypothetical protein
MPVHSLRAAAARLSRKRPKPKPPTDRGPDFVFLPIAEAPMEDGQWTRRN